MKKSREPAPQPIPAPDHLSETARALWASVVPKRAKSPERLTLVRLALEALDAAEEARRTVAMQGSTSVTKATGAIHVHPLLKVRLENLAFFERVWNGLGFRQDPHIPSWAGMNE